MAASQGYRNCKSVRICASDLRIERFGEYIIRQVPVQYGVDHFEDVNYIQ